MTPAVIFEQVKEVIREGKVSPPADFELTLETNITKDLPADSLDLVEFVMDLEEKFNLEIPEGALDGLETLGDIVNYLATRLAA